MVLVLTKLLFSEGFFSCLITLLLVLREPTFYTYVTDLLYHGTGHWDGILHPSMFMFIHWTLPSISDSKGAQRTARRESATAKLHRRHPNEHHRATPRVAGGAQVMRRQCLGSDWTFLKV